MLSHLMCAGNSAQRYWTNVRDLDLPGGGGLFGL